ncbi:phosphotransferase [Phaeobacter sp. QD34_3]|uniref:aminoglycoside phosphotransferase family protein n=1 Tax=unclassified Phaeobacter TaxID=2621772 RepID=UPI00237F10F4|nr:MULTISPECIES: phosphotransferase [unclassified Phaeobacter]MDE4134758.1 phosphotransferase [Phaeobacter sp. QD34_3]MDE4138378.1 phosphotransferase [Phaeobacter sp. QD34_24]
MTDRTELITTFLEQAGYGSWTRSPLAGDASMRRYERLSSAQGETLVLMDAPPEKGEDIRPFVEVDSYLRAQGVSAPEILAEDAENGFLLTEDLGDALFSTVIRDDPSQEMLLYRAATDLLLALHRAPVPDLAPLGPRVMAEMASLVMTSYRAGILGEEDEVLTHRFEDQFEDILRHSVKGDMVFVHRDFHVQNLLWLPQREGIARVGVIDFQDARTGHPAYDLVSLLQDARRDVPAGVEMQMIDHYIEASGVDASGFRTAYAVIGVQRNLRILGIFARLSQEMGKPQYLELIPHVWAHVMRGLEHPALATLSDWLRNELPAPSAENLDRLR